jgi:hypothetical protein
MKQNIEKWNWKKNQLQKALKEKNSKNRRMKPKLIKIQIQIERTHLNFWRVKGDPRWEERKEKKKKFLTGAQPLHRYTHTHDHRKKNIMTLLDLLWKVVFSLKKTRTCCLNMIMTNEHYRKDSIAPSR